MYIISPSLDDEAQPLVVHFTYPMISLIARYYRVSTFHHLSKFVLKTECLPYISVENLTQKYGQEGFFHLISVKTKHQSNEHNQAGANGFQCLIRIF